LQATPPTRATMYPTPCSPPTHSGPTTPGSAATPSSMTTRCTAKTTRPNPSRSARRRPSTSPRPASALRSLTPADIGCTPPSRPASARWTAPSAPPHSRDSLWASPNLSHWWLDWVLLTKSHYGHICLNIPLVFFWNFTNWLNNVWLDLIISRCQMLNRYFSYAEI